MIQAVIFDKFIWTTALARKFLKKHKFKPIKKVHITDRYYRYRLHNPKKFSRMRTKSVPKWHLKFIIGFN